MPRVELVYDPDCPNVQRARRAMLESFRQARLEPSWTEWDRTSSESPASVREVPAIAGPRGSSGWRSSLVSVPGIAFAFLPKLACPACWPAYAGLLSSVGLGFLADAAYLFPLTSVFLVLTVGALGFRAGARRGYGPCGVGLAGALVVLVGKFLFDANAAWYGGIGVLMAASVWNTWPQRTEEVGFCVKCVQQKPAIDTQNAPSRRF